MSKWTAYNFNDTVRVRLTDFGRSCIIKNHNDLFGARASEFHPAHLRTEDGWSEFHLWELVQQFGPHVHMGMRYMPFENNVIEIRDEP